MRLKYAVCRRHDEEREQKYLKINIICVRIIGFGAHIIPTNRRRVAFMNGEKKKCALDIESAKKRVEIRSLVDAQKKTNYHTAAYFGHLLVLRGAARMRIEMSLDFNSFGYFSFSPFPSRA